MADGAGGRLPGAMRDVMNRLTAKIIATFATCPSRARGLSQRKRRLTSSLPAATRN
jgi:hypothetical protein